MNLKQINGPPRYDTLPKLDGVKVEEFFDESSGLFCVRGKLGGFRYPAFEMAYDARVMGHDNWQAAMRRGAKERAKKEEKAS